ncbi:MAG: flippase-like domain-containing protein [Gracilimonas sp.]|uniref:lysylphosphatidylglycerol synthase transmembrane domain-containing protein n=1 Tax=Gracilimonas sp. TaxID=1974203 RepID=UPI001983C931|nr:lysylphosphatidylglycerol synthase transmembrane domain-containing protein [Gracilimonas sp.]MBD3617384.1 flippase-like domain-containing protein [Gracilimonas sp.]
MQTKKFLKVLGSVALGVLFLWLAFREVEFSELIESTRGMSWFWILPFTAATLLAHYIRAIRWEMLFTNKEKVPAKTTLFTGVLFGYLVNIPLPRVGEVARPVYVARQVDESNSKIIGTIVLERVVDLLGMLLLMAFVVVFLIADPQVLSRLFGIDITNPETQFNFILTLGKYGLIAFAGIGVLYWLFKKASERTEGRVSDFVYKIQRIIKTFVDGLLAIRELKNWPLFIFHSILIWVFYIGMTYIGFWMFNMQEVFDLGITEAIVLTVVSAVGISIPTPGGIGTYHLFITKALFIFYAVPEATGLAYATIAHATTLIIIIISSPLLLTIDKFVMMKNEEQKSTENIPD